MLSFFGRLVAEEENKGEIKAFRKSSTKWLHQSLFSCHSLMWATDYNDISLCVTQHQLITLNWLKEDDNERLRQHCRAHHKDEDLMWSQKFLTARCQLDASLRMPTSMCKSIDKLPPILLVCFIAHWTQILVQKGKSSNSWQLYIKYGFCWNEAPNCKVLMLYPHP